MIIYYFLIQKLVCKTNFKYKKENKKLGRHFLSQEKNVQNTTEKNLEIENIVPCYTLNCSGEAGLLSECLYSCFTICFFLSNN